MVLISIQGVNESIGCYGFGYSCFIDEKKAFENKIIILLIY